MLRLTNIYGPRGQMKHDHYGVVNWFIRLALDGTPIPVFGDGSLKRDFVYIDDAIDAILRTAVTDACYGEILNVGYDKPQSFLALAKTIAMLCKNGSYTFTEFTPERAAQEPGHFASDIRKIKKFTGWRPTTPLKDGIAQTMKYYRKYKNHYW